jgi:peptidoglycan hydrolase-like protein with peptidoglycan-binding domain
LKKNHKTKLLSIIKVFIYKIILMKKTIRITESKLTEIISKIISEQFYPQNPFKGLGDWTMNNLIDPTSDKARISRGESPRQTQLPREKQPWNGQDEENLTPPDIQKTQLVKYIQQKLGVTADGIYGPMTARAVRNLQSKSNIVPTGIIYAGDPTSKLFYGAPWGSVKMLSNLGTTPMNDPVKKPVSPVAPPRDTTPINPISSKPATNVSGTPQKAKYWGGGGADTSIQKRQFGN